jgi:hypothetical protein
MQSRHNIKSSIEFFENVAMLKYFGMTVNNQNYINEKVKGTVN